MTNTQDWIKELESLLIDWEGKSHPVMGAFRVKARMDALVPLIERIVTQNTKEVEERIRESIGDLQEDEPVNVEHPHYEQFQRDWDTRDQALLEAISVITLQKKDS